MAEIKEWHGAQVRPEWAMKGAGDGTGIKYYEVTVPSRGSDIPLIATARIVFSDWDELNPGLKLAAVIVLVSVQRPSMYDSTRYRNRSQFFIRLGGQVQKIRQHEYWCMDKLGGHE